MPRSENRLYVLLVHLLFLFMFVHSVDGSSCDGSTCMTQLRRTFPNKWQWSWLCWCRCLTCWWFISSCLNFPSCGFTLYSVEVLVSLRQDSASCKMTRQKWRGRCSRRCYWPSSTSGRCVRFRTCALTYPLWPCTSSSIALCRTRTQLLAGTAVRETALGICGVGTTLTCILGGCFAC